CGVENEGDPPGSALCGHRTAHPPSHLLHFRHAGSALGSDRYSDRVKILVLGSGAREHAIITALLGEDAGHEIIAGPGNAGIAAVVPVIHLDSENPTVVTDFAV